MAHQVEYYASAIPVAKAQRAGILVAQKDLYTPKPRRGDIFFYSRLPIFIIEDIIK